jgi:cell division septation protein DedD
MAVERYSSKTDVVVKLVLVFFISLLSFSIGTFVGKKFSDNQHKLAQLEPHSNTDGSHSEETSQVERGVASISPDVTEVKPTQTLSDDEIAKLAEEFVSDEETNPTDKAHDSKLADLASAHNKALDNERIPASEVKKEEAHSPSPAAKKVAEGASHEVEKMQATKPSTIPTALPKEVAASAAGKFTVQVASYPKEDEAKNMASELKGKGFSAFYIEAEIKGQKWYRVNVGLFTTQKEAQAYKDDLLARAKISSAIVQKIVK